MTSIGDTLIGIAVIVIGVLGIILVQGNIKGEDNAPLRIGLNLVFALIILIGVVVIFSIAGNVLPNIIPTPTPEWQEQWA